MKFYAETKDDSSDIKGPIDASGWPTIHPSLIVEADNIESAREILNTRFPNNILEVLPL